MARSRVQEHNEAAVIKRVKGDQIQVNKGEGELSRAERTGPI
jgi:hypothetical protein